MRIPIFVIVYLLINYSNGSDDNDRIGTHSPCAAVCDCDGILNRRRATKWAFWAVSKANSSAKRRNRRRPPTVEWSASSFTPSPNSMRHPVSCLFSDSSTIYRCDILDDLPSCSNTNLGRNDVIRERRQPTKAEIKSVFENKGLRANGELPKAPTNGTTFETVPARAATAPAKAEITAPKAKAAAPKAETSAPKAKAPTPRAETTAPKAKAPAPRAETTAFKAKAPAPIAEIAAPKPATRLPKAEPSPAPRTPTQPKAATTTQTKQQAPKPPAPQVPDGGGGSKSRAPQQPSFQIDDDEEDGNFKIHFVDNIGHNFAEDSDDDSWAGNDGRSSPINYSSQATSIFFGEEEEPSVVRPRNVIVNSDDDDDDDDTLSNGSSASA